MKWLQANAVVVLSVVVIGWLGYALVRALMISWRARHPASVSEDFSRAERLRQEIRRKAAERLADPAAVPHAGDALPAPARRRRFWSLEPFGGPVTRLWRRLRSSGREIRRR